MTSIRLQTKTVPPPPSPNDLDDPFGNIFYDDPVEEMGVKVCSVPLSLFSNTIFISALQATSSTAVRLPPVPFSRDSRAPDRGRGGGGFPRGQRRGRGVKRPLSSGRGGKSDPRPSAVNSAYSLETLQSAEFPEGMALADLGAKMAQALGEMKPVCAHFRLFMRFYCKIY